MGEKSKIEWTDATMNPWIGCTKVAEGCAHCYAEAFAKRTGKAKWGPNGTRVKTSESYWKQPLKWNREAEAAGERRRVFCASMADVFEDWQGPICDSHGLIIRKEAGNKGDMLTLDDVRRDLFALIDATPYLDWLLLTKRPENIRRMWYRGNNPPGCPVEFQRGDIFASALAYFRFNTWLGTSIATQADADRNIPLLRECRILAPVLFLSIEPLVEAVNLNLAGIDWVIVGGESGHGARPCHPDWVRSIRDQCKAAAVPFFFKQWGEWIENGEGVGSRGDRWGCLSFTGEWVEYPRLKDSVVRPVATGVCLMRVGKANAGRLLDGVEYSEFPATVTT